MKIPKYRIGIGLSIILLFIVLDISLGADGFLGLAGVFTAIVWSIYQGQTVKPSCKHRHNVYIVGPKGRLGCLKCNYYVIAKKGRWVAQPQKWR